MKGKLEVQFFCGAGSNCGVNCAKVWRPPALLRARWPPRAAYRDANRLRALGGGKHSAAAAFHSHLVFELHLKARWSFLFYFNASNYDTFLVFVCGRLEEKR